MDIESLIGIGAATASVPVLTEHIKGFCRAVQAALRGWSHDPSVSAWPLVADLVGAGWALALFYSGQLPVSGPLLAVLVGLAIGSGTATVYGAVKGAAE